MNVMVLHCDQESSTGEVIQEFILDQGGGGEVGEAEIEPVVSQPVDRFYGAAGDGPHRHDDPGIAGPNPIAAAGFEAILPAESRRPVLPANHRYL